MSINVENSFIVNYRGIYRQVISAQKKRGIRHPNDRLFFILSNSRYWSLKVFAIQNIVLQNSFKCYMKFVHYDIVILLLSTSKLSTCSTKNSKLLKRVFFFTIQSLQFVHGDFQEIIIIFYLS